MVGPRKQYSPLLLGSATGAIFLLPVQGTGLPHTGGTWQFEPFRARMVFGKWPVVGLGRVAAIAEEGVYGPDETLVSRGHLYVGVLLLPLEPRVNNFFIPSCREC